MSSSNFSSAYLLTPLDWYYLTNSESIFLYGYMILMIVGLVGNICQVMTFSRKTMRKISTGVLFLALSISDTIYLLVSIYVIIADGFAIPDRSDYAQTCRLRHFISYLTTNFSAWMLTTISCDRWFRSQFPLRSQRLCTPRTAIYSIMLALIFDCALHVHILTRMFGQIAPGITTNCGANVLYPTYVYFYEKIWPMMTILSVTIIPASCMLAFAVAIAINVKNSRNRVRAFQETNVHEKRRTRFLHRQMIILMLATLILFFLTTFPVAVFRFALATLSLQQSFSFSLFLTAIFGLITQANYALNFYLHSLTSKLFRREFFQLFPCSMTITLRQPNHHHHHHPRPMGTVTQLTGQLSNTNRTCKALCHICLNSPRVLLTSQSEQ